MHLGSSILLYKIHLNLKKSPGPFGHWWRWVEREFLMLTTTCRCVHWIQPVWISLVETQRSGSPVCLPSGDLASLSLVTFPPVWPPFECITSRQTPWASPGHHPSLHPCGLSLHSRLPCSLLYPFTIRKYPAPGVPAHPLHRFVDPSTPRKASPDVGWVGVPAVGSWTVFFHVSLPYPLSSFESRPLDDPSGVPGVWCALPLPKPKWWWPGSAVSYLDCGREASRQEKVG